MVCHSPMQRGFVWAPTWPILTRQNRGKVGAAPQGGRHGGSTCSSTPGEMAPSAKFPHFGATPGKARSSPAKRGCKRDFQVEVVAVSEFCSMHSYWGPAGGLAYPNERSAYREARQAFVLHCPAVGLDHAILASLLCRIKRSVSPGDNIRWASRGFWNSRHAE